ncbi:MAG TPA: hypothetical protein DD827_06775, partial [Gammaproteobacteria bacterium]|nr:hypothetical protein [Gammaproteobacteria bacterium]
MKSISRYQEILSSPLYNISDPETLDDFWADLSDRADQSWYLRDLHEDIPATPADELDIQEFIIKADALLQKNLKLGTAMIVEVDSKTAPTLIRLHSDASLNGKSSEDWTLSLDTPSSQSNPDASIMEKGGPLLRWFSSHTSATDETPNENDTVKKTTDQDNRLSLVPETKQIDSELDATFALRPESKDLTEEPITVKEVKEIDSITSETSMNDPTQPSIEAAAENLEQPSAPGYLDQFDGRLVAIRKWEDLDTLWAGVHSTAGEGWYIYTVGEKPPTETEESQTVHKFLLDVDQTLREEHKEDY